jgi:hypothetical protein
MMPTVVGLFAGAGGLDSASSGPATAPDRHRGGAAARLCPRSYVPRQSVLGVQADRERRAPADGTGGGRGAYAGPERGKAPGPTWVGRRSAKRYDDLRDRKNVPPHGGARVEPKSAQPLPKTLSGAVCAQWVRCGRPNCRCSRGQLHGPYHYRFWREGGRLRKEYIRPEDLEEVRARCEARRQFRRELRAGWQQWRSLAGAVREAELARKSAGTVK